MVGHYVSPMADNAFSRGKLAIRNQVNIRAANDDEIRTSPTRRGYCSASYCAFERCSFTDGNKRSFFLSLSLCSFSFLLLFQEATTVSRVPQSRRSYFSPLSPRSASKAAYAPIAYAPVSRGTSDLAVVFAANYIAALICTASCIQSSRNVTPPPGQSTHYRSQFRRFRLYEADERAR